MVRGREKETAGEEERDTCRGRRRERDSDREGERGSFRRTVDHTVN